MIKWQTANDLTCSEFVRKSSNQIPQNFSKITEVGYSYSELKGNLCRLFQLNFKHHEYIQ